MMDPYNLAICFGPTLVPVPDDKDQVQYQNLVNELIKNIIIYNDEIFPNDYGCVYEKYISAEPEDPDVGDLPSDHAPEDLDSVYPSEDDSENMEATAQFDFIARSDRELSLQKGDTVTLYSQVSNDWWRGAVNGHEGLIPDKYISLKMKDDDKEKIDNLKSSSSEESVRRRASSSNDSEGSLPVTHTPLIHSEPITWTNAPNVSDTAEASTSSAVLLSQPRESKSGYSLHKLADFSLDSCINTQDETISHRTTININHSQSQSITINGVSPLVTHKNTNENQMQNISSRLGTEHPQKKSEASEVDDSNVNFSQNREQWQRRAHSQSNIKIPQSLKLNRHSESWMQRQHHTPDLVMDLPLVSSCSPKDTSKKTISVSASPDDDAVSVKSLESPTGPDSPDMTTAAERFAKQNQCTLKKNTKIHVETSDELNGNDLVAKSSPVPDSKVADSGSGSNSFKPQIMAKPAVLKKPVFCVAQEVLQNDQPDQT